MDSVLEKIDSVMTIDDIIDKFEKDEEDGKIIWHTKKEVDEMTKKVLS